MLGTAPPETMRAAKLRSDLIFSRQGEGEKSGFVIKDPVARRFYRFGEMEYFIAQQLDGATSPETVQQRVTERFGATPSLKTLEEFEARLRTLRLVESDPSERKAERKTSGRVGGSLLYMRLKAVDPDHFFSRLVTKVQFLFTPFFIVLSAACILLALRLTVHNWSEISRQLAVMLRFQSLLLAWLVVLLVVTLHEFAHGLTCKHFGGHVNEIGFLLIYFQPAFYCNVSDAWLFPERSKRLWVTFAGAYFEMFLWAVATFVWKLAEPGSTIQYLALVVVATSAVKSLFNLNPLIKLDGYYLLSDYLEIPNLRQRASRYLRSAFLPSWASSAPSGEISERDRRIFLIYGGLSAVYSSWLLYIVATWAARYLVAQYRGLGFLAFCALLGMVFWNSIKKGVSALTTKLPQLWQNSGIRSQPKRAALAAGAILIVLFLPWADLDQGGQFTVLPERNADVHAEVSGFIDQVLVQEGQTVRPGDDLATISDRDLKAQREEVAAQVQAQQAKLLLLVNGPRPQEIAMAQDAVATATTRAQFTRKSFKDEKQLRAQRLASAEAALKKAETEHTFAQKNLRRYEELWRAGLTAQKAVDDAQESVAVKANEEKVAGAALEMVRSDSLAQVQGGLAVSEKQLAEAQSKLRSLLAGSRPEEIAAARAELARLQAECDFLDHQIGLTKVVSPVAGVVATHRTRELVGKFVQKGDPILKVDELKTVTAEMSVPEQEVETVRVGQPVMLRTASYPGLVFSGQVTSIAPQASEPDAQQLERRFLVDTELDNSRDLLKPGMSGAAKIYCGKRSPFELARRRATRFLRVEFWSWW